jgi:hypothetical protein
MHHDPEDTEARKRNENGPPEDSAARAIAEELNRLYGIIKAALSPANAMLSIEQMELRKMRQYDPVRFAKHLNAKIVERQAAGDQQLASVTNLRDWRSVAKKPTADPPPRSPTPRSPMRQTVPTRKVETVAMSKHNRPYGDWFNDEVA